VEEQAMVIKIASLRAISKADDSIICSECMTDDAGNEIRPDAIFDEGNLEDDAI